MKAIFGVLLTNPAHQSRIIVALYRDFFPSSFLPPLHPNPSPSLLCYAHSLKVLFPIVCSFSAYFPSNLTALHRRKAKAGRIYAGKMTPFEKAEVTLMLYPGPRSLALYFGITCLYVLWWQLCKPINGFLNFLTLSPQTLTTDYITEALQISHWLSFGVFLEMNFSSFKMVALVRLSRCLWTRAVPPKLLRILTIQMTKVLEPSSGHPLKYTLSWTQIAF